MRIFCIEIIAAIIVMAVFLLLLSFKSVRYCVKWTAWLTWCPSQKAAATLDGRSAQPLSSDRLECMYDEKISRRSSVDDKTNYYLYCSIFCVMRS